MTKATKKPLLERMRDGCGNLRDLAIIDTLASTGMRVGELVLLNREDINFEEREKGEAETVLPYKENKG